MSEAENIIRRFVAKPEKLAESFHTPLLFQEEHMLRGLEQELGARVSRILERTMAGAEAEMHIPAEDQAYVREINRLRRAIHAILLSQGTLGAAHKTEN